MEKLPEPASAEDLARAMFMAGPKRKRRMPGPEWEGLTSERSRPRRKKRRR